MTKGEQPKLDAQESNSEPSTPAPKPKTTPSAPVPEDKDANPSRKSLMQRADFPYVVTLLVAFLSWGITHAVDRLTELPLVKVTQTVDEQADVGHVTLEFENITSNVNFRDLTIRILGETQQHRFSPPKTTIIGGGWDGNADLFKEQDGIQLEFPDFHPRWRLKLTTDIKPVGMPRVQMESAGVPTILEPVGLRTWLVEWELCIIGSFAVFALISIIVWARGK